MRTLVRHALSFLIVLGLWFLPAQALAYPWMIKHEYTSCGTCHADPSGGGLLTTYGRAQSAVLLSSFFPNTDGEPTRFAAPAFGAVPDSEDVLVGGFVRNGVIWNYAQGELVDRRWLQMRADLAAQVRLGRLRASGMLGYQRSESAALAQRAWVTREASWGNLVSREHWIGYEVDDTVLVRAGRLNLPFGLRNVEHTSWVRAATRTDTNQSQQHGLAASFVGERWRGEAMAIAGNFQLAPDRYRERGYSAFVERTIGARSAVGLSSLVTRASRDVESPAALTRQAHGAFSRIGIAAPLVVLAEADALVRASSAERNVLGYVAWIQADVEPVRGLHAVTAFELERPAVAARALGAGVWLGAAWYPAPHFELRIDAIRRGSDDAIATTTLLAQAQLYL